MTFLLRPFREKKAAAASFYLVVYILILGNWGALYEYYQYYKSPVDERDLSNYITALVHFSPTIIFVSLARLLMKPPTSLRVLFLVALTIASCFMPFFILELLPATSRETGGYLFMLFAAVLWWAAFASDPEFSSNPDDSVGGSVNKKLKGSITEFKS